TVAEEEVVSADVAVNERVTFAQRRQRGRRVLGEALGERADRRWDRRAGLLAVDLPAFGEQRREELARDGAVEAREQPHDLSVLGPRRPCVQSGELGVALTRALERHPSEQVGVRTSAVVIEYEQ